MKIGIVAGEASGDLLGAHLLQQLQQKASPIIEGIGGPAMIAANCHSLCDIERLSVMGLIEPLMRLPELIRLRRKLLQHFLNQKPAVFIGIDAPDFNLGLEFKLKKANIPVVHYVSPSVWAWRKNRIKKIKKSVDMMLTLFPFETEFYHRHEVPVQYVGHPLAESIPLEINQVMAKRALCLDESTKYVALLPGSREQELHNLSATFLQAAVLIQKQFPEIQFITSHINEERYQTFKAYQQQIAPHLTIHCFTRRSHDVLAASEAVLVTSGTATLETMLFKKPMVIAYRMPKFAYQLAKLLVDIPFIGLPNLLANEQIVPECIQAEATPAILAEHILNYLQDPAKAAALADRFTQIHEDMKVNSATKAADVIYNLIENRVLG